MASNTEPVHPGPPFSTTGDPNPPPPGPVPSERQPLRLTAAEREHLASMGVDGLTMGAVTIPLLAVEELDEEHQRLIEWQARLRNC